jgi:DNA modification methylase
MSYTIHHGDVLAVLRGMADESVHCCVTSPPYFGLRDYGHPDQIGLEPTPADYVAKMVEVFAEVRRVLRADGTLWLNLGDSYAANRAYQVRDSKHTDVGNHMPSRVPDGLKPKDLIGIPWRVALALQADGWWLRSDIIWAKRAPMPESVRDRCTRSHEYIFMLAKAERYHFDSAAIMEPLAESTARDKRLGVATGTGRARYSSDGMAACPSGMAGGKAEGRNKRSVWELPPMSTPDAHFATFPIELPETCIKAACPADGVVLDVFAGSGTTGLAAIKNGRRFVGIELNPAYIKIAHDRLYRHYPLLGAAS